MSILIYRNEQQEGPFDLETIQAGIDSGKFSPDDFAWQDGCEDWVPLKTLLPASPPPPVPKESSKAPASPVDKLVGDDQDRKVVEKFIKNASDLLTKGEEIEYIAIQKKPIVNIAPDGVILTNKRFILVHPKLTGMTFQDHIWREVADVHVSEQMIGATITCNIVGGKILSLDSLPKKQARKVYAYAQEVEERMAVERRDRELEEKRAAAGGVVLQSPSAPAATPSPSPAEDPIATLEKLKKMLDGGLIESSEYETKKAEILSRM